MNDTKLPNIIMTLYVRHNWTKFYTKQSLEAEHS